MPAEAGTGRPPEYCDNAAHTRAAAWRARQRRQQEAAGQPDTAQEPRPVDAARQRASEIGGQVAGMIEHLQQQLHLLVDQLRTAGDPDAAEAQIESVASEAAEQVAAANARASRAEQAQRTAQADRAEADAAAVEATERADQAAAGLEQTRAQLTQLEDDLEQTRGQLAQAQADTQAAHDQLAQLHDDLAGTREQLSATQAQRDDALARAEAAAQAQAGAEEHARAEARRAERTEAELDAVRAELDAARADLDRERHHGDQLRDQITDLRATTATLTAQRDAARADLDREREHGDQRVADLRSTYETQLAHQGDELAQARSDAQDQRTRADRAEAQLAAAQERVERLSQHTDSSNAPD
jgi:chromosome segregation ATPase